MAESISSKSSILKQSNECFKNFHKKSCKELVSQIEIFQLTAFDQNNFKCQSSLLGLQSEIISAYFFKNLSHQKLSFMMPYVIKNC